VAAPTTIAQIHENAEKEKAAAEKDSYNRQIGGSRRGGDRGAGGEMAPVLETESSSETETMLESEARKKIGEDSKEFFGVRNLDEAEMYFTNLPVEHHFRLVDKFVSSAVESKESDAQLVGDFFSRAAAKRLCSPAAFDDGFTPTAELLDDTALDAPKAFNFMAIMMKGAGLDEDRRTRIASKSDALLALLS